GGVYHQRVFRNVLPSPLATNAGLRIARTPCVRGPQACTPAHGSACVHLPCADMHAAGHACTSLVLTCTPENMPARGSCWHTRQGTCLDVARADLHRFVYPLITVISISMFSSRWTSAKRSRSWLIFVRTGTASSASS